MPERGSSCIRADVDQLGRPCKSIIQLFFYFSAAGPRNTQNPHEWDLELVSGSDFWCNLRYLSSRGRSRGSRGPKGPKSTKKSRAGFIVLSSVRSAQPSTQVRRKSTHGRVRPALLEAPKEELHRGGRLDGYKNAYLYKIWGPPGPPSEPPSPVRNRPPRGRARGLLAIPNNSRIDAKSKNDQ